MRKIGKIKWFGGHNNKTGRQNDFGFIACEGKPNDIFVHLRQINCSATALIEETIVTFEVITNFRDGKEEAKNLRLLIDETDTEIITFCATNKDPNLWIPVFSKYLANFSIDEAILLIFQKLETLSEGEIVSFVRTLPNQILFSHKARKIRETLAKDEHLNLCVKMFNERVSLLKNYSFKEEINATIEGASVQFVEKIWDSIPSELYVDVPEQRKRFNLKIHARCLVKLILDPKDDQSKSIFLMELRECLKEANKDEFWEIIPDEILIYEQIWPITIPKRRVRILVNKLEKTENENHKEIISELVKTIAKTSINEHSILLLEIPEWLKENEAFFPFKSPFEQVNLVWDSIEAGLWSSAWPRFSKEAKIICIYRVLKYKINTNTFFAELEKLKTEKPENEPLVKYVINILWAKDRPARRNEAFQKSHEFLQEWVIEQAWNSTEPLSLYPILPLCQPKKVDYCEGKPWPTEEDKASGAKKVSRAFCPRANKSCSLFEPNTERNFSFGLEGARLYAECTQDWKDWSLLELLQATGVVPSLPDLKSDEYVQKLSGWINRLNEIRDRLKCSVCSQTMTPNDKYSKGLARYNMTVASCKKGNGHDQNIYFNHCWACYKIIDSRESKIQLDGLYICIHCGSGAKKSLSYSQGDRCPKCGTAEMKQKEEGSRFIQCSSCQHTIRLPAQQHLTGYRWRGYKFK